MRVTVSIAEVEIENRVRVTLFEHNSYTFGIYDKKIHEVNT